MFLDGAIRGEPGPSNSEDRALRATRRIGADPRVDHLRYSLSNGITRLARGGVHPPDIEGSEGAGVGAIPALGAVTTSVGVVSVDRIFSAIRLTDVLLDGTVRSEARAGDGEDRAFRTARRISADLRIDGLRDSLGDRVTRLAGRHIYPPYVEGAKGASVGTVPALR